LKQQSLIDFTLYLADNALILGQRNAAWCGHGPVLEQDIALTNISLDLIGQARNFYQYAAQIINSPLQTSPHGGGLGALQLNGASNQSEGSKVSPPDGARDLEGAGAATEDTLAYLRTEREFKNCLLAEQPNGDWGQTILRQFFFSIYQSLLFQQLQNCKDEQIAAIAAKSLKEVTYHVRWSSEWVIRLGDGTEESHDRMQHAVSELWMYTGELFEPAAYETDFFQSMVGNDIATIKTKWLQKVKDIFEEATLLVPEKVFMHKGGKEGKHTEHLGYILAEMQYLQRVYPGAEW
jgi:ring-1,2-phenylacetyl-CoA epoxidase subunit PaaC